MRIVRGKLQSRRIQVPKGFSSRPTTDFAKEGLFNVLDNLIEFEGISVLDLCSGTGNISLEFASGGAEKVTSVDLNFACVNYLKKIAKELDVDHQINTIKSDILVFLDRCSEKYDVIFCDLPYSSPLYAEVVLRVFQRDVLATDGLLIMEHGKQTSLQMMEHYLYTKNYGGVQFSFFQK